MEIIPSKNQEEIAQEAVNWYFNSSDPTFQISGNPGTGKSFLLHYIVSKLGVSKVAPMAFTGAAAIVMRTKGFYDAKTIHSTILEPVEDFMTDKNGNKVMNDYFGIPESKIRFVPKRITPYDIELFVIDEGMMVPKPLRDIIEGYGIKCIVAGDVDQLPPVKYEPGYFTTGKIHYLTEIFRQKKNSGIIYLSQRLKRGMSIHQGFYGDCTVIYDDEVTTPMMVNADVVICAKNDTRQMLTNMMRYDIFGIDSMLPLHGERLVCRSNNWQLEIDGINLANGLVGTVANYPDVTKLQKNKFLVDFKPLLLNNAFKDVEVDYNYFKAPFKEKQKLKFDKWNKAEKLEYGYVLTTHIAQGSEYGNVVYFQEYLNPNINNQLWYTGITRASNHCYFVKHRRRSY